MPPSLYHKITRKKHQKATSTIWKYDDDANSHVRSTLVNIEQHKTTFHPAQTFFLTAPAAGHRDFSGDCSTTMVACTPTLSDCSFNQEPWRQQVLQGVSSLTLEPEFLRCLQRRSACHRTLFGAQYMTPLGEFPSWTGISHCTPASETLQDDPLVELQREVNNHRVDASNVTQSTSNTSKAWM